MANGKVANYLLLFILIMLGVIGGEMWQANQKLVSIDYNIDSIDTNTYASMNIDEHSENTLDTVQVLLTH